MIIDCETHVFPRNYEFHRTHVEHLLEDMDRCGVDKTYLMFYCDSTLTSPCGELTDPAIKRLGKSDEEVWQYFLESWQQHPDRFYFFNATDPRDPKCIEKLEEQHKLGLQGLGETLPFTQNILPNGPEYMSVYRFAAEKGLPVVLTMERWEQCLCLPSKDFDEVFDMFEQVIREFSGVRFMFAHGGNCAESVVLKDAETYLQGNLRPYQLAGEVDNLWISSGMPWWFYENRLSPMLDRQMEFLRDYVGFSRVTWGSDWPYNGSHRFYSFKSDYDTVVGYYRDVPFISDEEQAYLVGGAAYEFVTGRQADRST